MTVYFAVARAKSDAVKIGVTTNISKREIALDGGVPGGVSILATLPGGMDVESYLHEKFAHHRLNGEWFAHSEEIKDFIVDVKNGKPGLVPFENVNQYKRVSVKQMAEEAVNSARSMMESILKAEHKGPGDTIDAAMSRIETRTGLSIFMMRRLRYRDKSDIWAGEYLTIKTVYDAMVASGTIKSVAANPSLVRLADIVAGRGKEGSGR